MNDQQENDARDWQSQFLAHAGNMPEIAISLCDGFLQEVPMLLSSVHQKIDSDQYAELHRPLHTLKSCLGYVASAEQLALAAELEQHVQQSGFVPCDDFRQRLKQLELIAADWVAKVREFKQQLARS